MYGLLFVLVLASIFLVFELIYRLQQAERRRVYLARLEKMSNRMEV
jgi:hypothetical protein